MSLIGPASKCGVTPATLQALLSGTATTSVAARLGVPSASLQNFVDGGSSGALAGKLGIPADSLQEMRKGFGKHGAIGLLVGLLLSSDD